MMTKSEIEKLLQNYKMKENHTLKKGKIEQWRINLGKIAILEKVLKKTYSQMLKEKKRKKHLEKKRRMQNAYRRGYA